MNFLTLSEAISANNTTLYTVVMAVLTTMSGAITVMWRALSSSMKESEKRLIVKLDKCEQEHKAKDEWAKDISLKVGELQGTVKSRDMAKEDLREITGEVVKQIDKRFEVVVAEVAQAVVVGLQ